MSSSPLLQTSTDAASSIQSLVPISTALSTTPNAPVLRYSPKTEYDALADIKAFGKDDEPLFNAKKEQYSLQDFYLRGLKVSKFLWRLTYVVKFLVWRFRSAIENSKLVHKLFETIVTAIHRIHVGINNNLRSVLETKKFPEVQDDYVPPKSDIDEDFAKMADSFQPARDISASLEFAADILESVIPDYNRVQPHLMLSYGQVFKTGVVAATQLFVTLPKKEVQDALDAASKTPVTAKPGNGVNDSTQAPTTAGPETGVIEPSQTPTTVVPEPAATETAATAAAVDSLTSQAEESTEPMAKL